MNIKICNNWNSYLEKIPEEKKDIYYTEEYTKLYEIGTDRAMCVICEEGNNLLLMPFLRRKIDQYYDFETAYGYGGPITNVTSLEWIHTALEETKKYFIKKNYICGFIRFHPLLGNALICKNAMEVIFDRHTIAVDMEPDIEKIWNMQISSKNRNMIRKAEKLGLNYRICYDYNSDVLDQFVSLYKGTMNRLNADEFYYFNKNYYHKFLKKLNGNAFIGMIELDNTIIGSAIFMVGHQYAHYHLAGSNRCFSSYGVNNYLLWNTIKELKKYDIKKFHLGGGTGHSSEDTLLRFKKSFSKSEEDFYIGKWIFNTDAYMKICRNWEEKYPDLISLYGSRLQKYRCGKG